MSKNVLRVTLKTPEDPESHESVELELEISSGGCFLHSSPEPSHRHKRVAADSFFHDLLKELEERGLRGAVGEMVENRGRIEGIRLCPRQPR